MENILKFLLNLFNGKTIKISIIISSMITLILWIYGLISKNYNFTDIKTLLYILLFLFIIICSILSMISYRYIFSEKKKRKIMNDVFDDPVQKDIVLQIYLNKKVDADWNNEDIVYLHDKGIIQTPTGKLPKKQFTRVIITKHFKKLLDEYNPKNK